MTARVYDFVKARRLKQELSELEERSRALPRVELPEVNGQLQFRITNVSGFTGPVEVLHDHSFTLDSQTPA